MLKYTIVYSQTYWTPNGEKTQVLWKRIQLSGKQSIQAYLKRNNIKIGSVVVIFKGWPNTIQEMVADLEIV